MVRNQFIFLRRSRGGKGHSWRQRASVMQDVGHLVKSFPTHKATQAPQSSVTGRTDIMGRWLGVKSSYDFVALNAMGSKKWGHIVALTALPPVVLSCNSTVWQHGQASLHINLQPHLQSQLRSRLAQSLWLGGTSCPGGPGSHQHYSVAKAEANSKPAGKLQPCLWMVSNPQRLKF